MERYKVAASFRINPDKNLNKHYRRHTGELLVVLGLRFGPFPVE